MKVFRAAQWLRIGLLALTWIILPTRIAEAVRPGGVLIVTLVITAWSLWTFRWTNVAAPRWTPRIIADTAVTTACVVLSRPLLGAELAASSGSTVTGFWQLAAAVLAVLALRDFWGVVPAAVISIATAVQFPLTSMVGWTQLGLILIVSLFVGNMTRLLNESQAERDASLATAAALAERERLNRIVHDGVLQVLALVEREGPELGPRGRLLSTLARAQEGKLRAMLQDKNVDVTAGETLRHDNTTDIATMLERHQSDTVTVSTMAGEVRMETPRAAELNAAVTEVLSNVMKHAGPGAQAWVLLELENGDITLSIRDNGVGLTPEQLQQAADSGRLGVRESIRGRIADIGGTAKVTSSPGHGVEWEFVVPLEQRSR